MTDCSTYPLNKRCFYVQTCSIDSAIGLTCCTTDCCVQGSIILVLSFVGVDAQTNTYYTQYYFVSSTQPPSPINGLGSRVVGYQFECLFNDGSKFQIRFSDGNLNIGRISIVTPAVAGEFCILDTALYNDFYSDRAMLRTTKVSSKKKRKRLPKDATVPTPKETS